MVQVDFSDPLLIVISVIMLSLSTPAISLMVAIIIISHYYCEYIIIIISSPYPNPWLGSILVKVSGIS
jgi:hypothetical protein